jgi:hypothetical protein
MGCLGKIVLASPPILGTPSLPTDDEILGLVSHLFRLGSGPMVPPNFS